jgi:hypothetical protein
MLEAMWTRPVAVGLMAVAGLLAACSTTPQAAPKTISVATTPPSSIPAGRVGSSAAPTTTAPATAPTQSGLPTGPIIKLADWSGVEPKTIGFSGDAGNIVSDITWSSWNADSAVGQGTWGYDNCEPSCAAGQVTPYPTTISLSKPSGGQFTLLTENQSGPHGQVSTYPLPSKFINGPS